MGDRAIPEDVAQVGSDDSGTPLLPTVFSSLCLSPDFLGPSLPWSISSFLFLPAHHVYISSSLSPPFPSSPLASSPF